MKELQIGLIHFLCLSCLEIGSFEVSHYKATNTSASVELIEMKPLNTNRLPVRTYYVADREHGGRIRMMSDLGKADVLITNI